MITHEPTDLGRGKGVGGGQGCVGVQWGAAMRRSLAFLRFLQELVDVAVGVVWGGGVGSGSCMVVYRRVERLWAEVLGGGSVGWGLGFGLAWGGGGGC
jgi:hypothetical protein